MTWYVAKIVFQITSRSARTVAQFDEHLRLISASSIEEAFLKARLIGISEEDPAPYGPAGTAWEFVNILELYPLKDLSDGMEIHSRIYETREAINYINLVHLRAAELAA